MASATSESPHSSPDDHETNENLDSMLNVEAMKISNLNESRTELLTRVQGLKKDLQEWRGRLDTQVKTYRQIPDVNPKDEEC